MPKCDSSHFYYLIQDSNRTVKRKTFTQHPLYIARKQHN